MKAILQELRKASWWQKHATRVFTRWLPIGFMVIFGTSLVYLTGQHHLRQSINAPLVQLSRDTAYSMASGQPSSSELPSTAVDMGRSLATFYTVYDGRGKPLSGNGRLNGQLAAPPVGVFDYSKVHGEYRLTWQPQLGTRIAAVVIPVAGGNQYVLAGRSLAETELQEWELRYICILATVLGLVTSYGLLAVLAAHKSLVHTD